MTYTLSNGIEISEKERDILQAWELIADEVYSVDFRNNKVDISQFNKSKFISHYINNEKQKAEFMRTIMFDIQYQLFKYTHSEEQADVL